MQFDIILDIIIYSLDNYVKAAQVPCVKLTLALVWEDWLSRSRKRSKSKYRLASRLDHFVKQEYDLLIWQQIWGQNLLNSKVATDLLIKRGQWFDTIETWLYLDLTVDLTADKIVIAVTFLEVLLYMTVVVKWCDNLIMIWQWLMW